MPARNVPVVAVSALPEFLRSRTVGEFVAAALDVQALAVQCANADMDTATPDPLAEAQAAIYRNAADEVRKFTHDAVTS